MYPSSCASQDENRFDPLPQASDKPNFIEHQMYKMADDEIGVMIDDEEEAVGV